MTEFESALAEAGVVTPAEAREILLRFVASHFAGRMGSTGEQARFSTPANPRCDDDIRMTTFIEQAERMRRALMVARDNFDALTHAFNVGDGRKEAARDLAQMCNTALGGETADG